MTNALIFGGGGIGQAVASALTQAGTRVVLISRDEGLAERLGVEGRVADLSVQAEVDEVCLWASKELGQVDLLVAALGRMNGSRLEAISSTELLRVMLDNVLATHLAVTRATPLLSPSAHRFVCGAYLERLALPGLGGYAAAKAAVDAWARVLMKEERAIKTTLLRLPAVDTQLWGHAPFPLPKGAMTPSAVAAVLLEAWREGKTGVVDVA
jgi:NAD(P)-dependent dehydrogenase (short-subunit alcohol dehydrogenase family)